jgi:hypothetical protein
LEYDERSTEIWLHVPAAGEKGLPVTAVHGPLVDAEYFTFMPAVVG